MADTVTVPNYGSGPGVNWNDFQKAQDASTNAFIDKSANMVNDASNTNKANFNTAVANDNTQNNNFSDSYRSAIPNLYQQGNDMYHVGDLQSLSNALGTRISQLTGNTNGAGAGGFVSADNVDKAINTNYLPRYQEAQNQFQTAADLSQKYVDTGTKPYEQQGSMMTALEQGQLQGLTTEDAKQLDGIMQVINTGGTLTKDEWDNANAIAQKQMDYEQAKMQAEYGYASNVQSAIEGNKYKVIGPGGAVVDTTTGKTVGGGGNFTFSGSSSPTKNLNTGGSSTSSSAAKDSAIAAAGSKINIGGSPLTPAQQAQQNQTNQNNALSQMLGGINLNPGQLQTAINGYGYSNGGGNGLSLAGGH